jgi:hypothetical protein
MQILARHVKTTDELYDDNPEIFEIGECRFVRFGQKKILTKDGQRGADEPDNEKKQEQLFDIAKLRAQVVMLPKRVPEFFNFISGPHKAYLVTSY